MSQFFFLSLITVIILTACSTSGVGRTFITGRYVYLVPKEKIIEISDKKNIEISFRNKLPYSFKEMGVVEAIASGKRSKRQDVLLELAKQASFLDSDVVYKAEIQHNKGKFEYRATGVAIKKLP